MYSTPSTFNDRVVKSAGVGPPSLIFKIYLVSFPGGGVKGVADVKLTIKPHLLSNLRMHEAITPLPYTTLMACTRTALSFMFT